jgi:ASPIC and UnbV/FG-GAP-like repeat/Secretion system C-terminal sorting domain
MKQIFTLAFLCLSSMGVLAQQDCAHPQAVGPGTYNVALTEGSQPPSTLCTTGTNNTLTKGAWFSYSPTEIHTTTISTAASGNDTRVHIYSGGCESLTCVGGDDDSGPNFTSIATFTAQAGATYYIVFDNNWQNTPEYNDNFSFILSEATFVPQAFTQQSININGITSCVVDMNGDYLDDIVGVDDGIVHILYQATNDSGFSGEDLTSPNTQNMPYWSIAAGDYNKDGFNDLLYGSGGGSTLMLSNSTGTAFATKIETPVGFLTQRTNFVDIDNDGKLDAFMCDDNAPNVYFLNDGNGGGTFNRSGLNGAPDLGVYPTGGNYASIWIDYNNDGNIDMYMAKCRGASNPAAIDELHRNNGDGTFTNVAAELGFADFHQSWSSAWADFDNDGDMDVLVGSNAGTEQNSPGGACKLIRHNEDGTFTNVTAGSGYDTFITTNRDYIAYDFDNDGFVDVFGGGNSIMHNNGDFTFSPLAVGFGPGPVGDLDSNGFLDVQSGNTLHMGYDNGNNWLKVTLKGIESNRNGIGARVEVHIEGSEAILTREIRSGEGFEYMSSLNAYFGLGEAEDIHHVVVKWPSGTVDVIENPEVNQAVLITEGQFPMSIDEAGKSLFSLYPNPAKDVLNIGGSLDIASANVYDLSGRLIRSVDVTDAMVPVQQLAKGSYIIILHDTSGKQYSSKFIKE